MRQAKEAQKIDLSVPVNMQAATDNCFGNEWKPTDKECASCGMADLCCTVYHKTVVQTRARKISKPKTHLDEVYFDVDRDRLNELLSDGLTTYQELFETISQLSKCYNPKLVTTWISLFMTDYGYHIVDDFVKKK